jgi:hypothetical protein
MMTLDQELGDMASMILCQHDERAPFVVVERIGQLTSEGEAEGGKLWRGVARRLDQLMRQDSAQ